MYNSQSKWTDLKYSIKFALDNWVKFGTINVIAFLLGFYTLYYFTTSIDISILIGLVNVVMVHILIDLVMLEIELHELRDFGD